MRKLVLSVLLILFAPSVRADFWGGDLPLLAQIVTNTLNTIMELQRQTGYMSDELAGIKDKIERIRSIADMIQPSSWEQWQDPEEAIRRLQKIYRTLPKEYRSEKSDMIESEISKAMNLVGRMSREVKINFDSGKELELRGSDASPGVAQKLTASGVGTLVSMEAQSQVLASHITSLLAQMLAEGNERESRKVISVAQVYGSVSGNLSADEQSFSQKVLMNWTQR